MSSRQRGDGLALILLKRIGIAEDSFYCGDNLILYKAKICCR